MFYIYGITRVFDRYGNKFLERENLLANKPVSDLDYAKLS